MQLEFGRGFTYNRPLRVNLLDLDFELAEQLVSNLAQAALPCNAGGKPMAGCPAGLSRAWITPSWLCSSPLPASRQLLPQMPQQTKFRADHSVFPLLKKPYSSQGFRSNGMGWDKMPSKAAVPKTRPLPVFTLLVFLTLQ